MAIDDNTVYGLTGAQVKELPEKIDAVKGMARELTTADYNANSSNWSDTDPANFDTVALWKLEPGYYVWPVSGVTINMTAINKWSNNDDRGNMARVSATRKSRKRITFINSDTGTTQGTALTKAVADVSLVATTGQGEQWEYPLYFSSIADNLNTTSYGAVLSANQGRVLNNKIGGDLSNLTTTDKTSLINAINELTSRVAALEGS